MSRGTKRAEDAPDEIRGRDGDDVPIDDADTLGVQHDGGQSVKEGLHGGSRRADARGRDEKVESGESAEFDRDRAERAGRHYGRRGEEQPGPGYGKGPLQPERETAAPTNHDTEK